MVWIPGVRVTSDEAVGPTLFRSSSNVQYTCSTSLSISLIPFLLYTLTRTVHVNIHTSSQGGPKQEKDI